MTSKKEIAALKEEIVRHVDRADKLEARLIESTKLLRGWWGYDHKNSYCLAMLKPTQEFLIIEAGSTP